MGSLIIMFVLVWWYLEIFGAWGVFLDLKHGCVLRILLPTVSQGHIWIMELAAAWLAPRNVPRRRTIHVEVLRLDVNLGAEHPAHGQWNNGSTQRIDDDQWLSSTNGTNQGLRFGDSWCFPLLNVPPRESTPFYWCPLFFIPSCDHFECPQLGGKPNMNTVDQTTIT